MSRITQPFSGTTPAVGHVGGIFFGPDEDNYARIAILGTASGTPALQFAVEAGGLLYLDFAAVQFSDPEERLSQLALWVIEAERARHPYGLRLPTAEIAPSHGESHFHRCLRTLALFK